MEQKKPTNILYDQKPLGPFPVSRLKRVDQPTTRVTNTGQRIDLRDIAYGLASRGEYGPAVQKGVQKSLPGKYPLSAALKDVIDHISIIERNPIAPQKAPISQEPDILTQHIKAAGYFLKADLMGACRVPESAYYSHDKQGNPIEPRFENAVIIVMRKDLQAMQAATGRDWMGDPISFQAYQHLGMV